MSIIRKTMIATLGTAIVLGSVGGSFASDRRDDRGGMQSFKKVDANSDGKLNFAEFAAPMIERFDDVDANKNGTITQAEVEKFADGRRQERMVKRIAKRFDIDNDNEVTKAELENRQRKMFALMDVNDDGFIAEDEMPKRHKERGGKRGDRG